MQDYDLLEEVHVDSQVDDDAVQVDDNDDAVENDAFNNLVSDEDDVDVEVEDV